ncbi:hypothetical protein [Aeromicrobium endophyticum]|uniref:Uncharacterized protein n=1 Tax=Aeromicrobium endophyticum TaxID=2292704 RepID=A0A371P930_9ACTN|nr:hypothetical protein [Aeromicrobium endophyticum]REK72441.1 hypothetical protein DX116_02080 [Aeromicrobium endophyticum]
MTAEPTVDTSARRLYGVDPATFVAERRAEAGRLREAGHAQVAKDVMSLRRPSVAAALVDAVVRHRPELVDEVAAVGRRLRAAIGDAEAGPADLRAADADRRSVVRRCVEAAAEVAGTWGSRASSTSLREVEQTFWAAAVDAGALAAVRAGCLVRPLSPSGFGAVDTTGSSAVEVVVEVEPSLTPRRRASRAGAGAGAGAGDEPARDDAALDRAHQRVQHAEQVLRQAEDEATTAAESASAAEAHTARLEQELAELRRRLTGVEQEIRDAAALRRRAAGEKQTAERRRRTASGAVDRARRDLHLLDGDG